MAERRVELLGLVRLIVESFRDQPSQGSDTVDIAVEEIMRTFEPDLLDSERMDWLDSHATELRLIGDDDCDTRLFLEGGKFRAAIDEERAETAATSRTQPIQRHHDSEAR